MSAPFHAFEAIERCTHRIHFENIVRKYPSHFDDPDFCDAFVNAIYDRRDAGLISTADMVNCIDYTHGLLDDYYDQKKDEVRSKMRNHAYRIGKIPEVPEEQKKRFVRMADEVHLYYKSRALTARAINAVEHASRSKFSEDVFKATVTRLNSSKFDRIKQMLIVPFDSIPLEDVVDYFLLRMVYMCGGSVVKASALTGMSVRGLRIRLFSNCKIEKEEEVD